MSDLVRELLSKRGITEVGEAERFLNPDYERDTHEPFLLAGMERAVQRLLLAIERKERIAIYADFDCDGIPGAALLSDFFNRLGYTNFEIYLPHRDREGYGLHQEAIDTLAAGGVSLVITVDVGTTAVAAVAHAKKKGIDVIVTDHHEVVGALPDCVAILNPKLEPYPFRDLCGAAVAWKLVQATISEGRKQGLEPFTKIPDGWEKWLLDMVALATVADMVPLTGENRALVHFGLTVLRKSPRLGINALCNRLRLRKSELTEDDIAFSLAPRINAASRMDEPELALRLLTTADLRQAETLVAHLEELNARRKSAVAAIVRQVRKRVRERFLPHERVAVLGDVSWKPALLGLAANSIMGDRGGVVCLWGRDANGNLKGSCRSDGGISVVDLFASTDAFEEAGGHERSGGFSVSYERVHALPESLADAAKTLEMGEVPTPKVNHDALLSLSEVSPTLFEEVSRLAPFGIGNPKPVFLVSDVVVTELRRFGRESAHLELLLECRRSGARTRAFDFFRAPERFTSAPAVGAETKVLGTLERDSFRGGYAVRLVDITSAA